MDELVRGFADGQVSRRVFIRRMVASGATLTGATMIANLIQAYPAEAGTQYAVIGVFDYSFDPVNVQMHAPDDYVTWQWDVSAGGHSVTDTSGLGLFDSAPNATPNPPPLGGWTTGSFGHGFWAAGTYVYSCKDTHHVPMAGKVRVPVQLSSKRGHAGTLVTATWGSKDLTADPTLRYDVQLRKPGRKWADWQTGVGFPAKAFKAKLVGRYQVRARLRDINADVALPYSPAAAFTAR